VDVEMAGLVENVLVSRQRPRQRVDRPLVHWTDPRACTIIAALRGRVAVPAIT
jgi:hypothetical protein